MKWCSVTESEVPVTAENDRFTFRPADAAATYDMEKQWKVLESF